jgi:putative ABC transport system permease protein
MADYRILADPAQFPEITVALAAVSGSSRLVAGDESSDGSINGVQANYADVKNLDVAYGRFLNSVEEEGQARVVVMGSQLTEDLFGSVNPLGKEVRIGNDIFTVIGVLESSGGNRFSSTDTQAFVPLSVAQSRLFTIDRYRGEAGTLSLFLGSIGAVSLLVGGIGIMNIMLVSVTERTKEIGLRRALGAQDGDILLQFLIESTVLCLLGGFIGLGISYGLAWLLSQLPAFTFQLIIDSSSVILALSVCSAAGFVFGLYPALRAMRLDPMEALRYE